ncbi:hypothetical protein ANN_14985 [Periplaneta americana]|uniref:Uncharacterized protein n=1 Tax=Periplaneta americana TaxID=6978 RepID=A0ABQ8SXT5_PERAM|nr:hypothetical protein ANN_14985 [Periplaneta americana]
MAGLCEGGNELLGSLKAKKVEVSYKVCSQRIIGPISFEETVNTDVCKNIFPDFVEQLDDIELTQEYFQQVGATCHTSNESMAHICIFFEDSGISKD